MARTHTHVHTHTHTHIPHTFPQWDTPSHSGTPPPTLRHTFPHWGTDTLKLDIPTLSAPKWALTGPTDLTPPPANIIVHTVGAARQGPAGSGVRKRNTLGRVSTPSVFCWHRVHSNTTNKHTLDEGVWSVGLVVGLHTCIRHTFHAPISSRYSNHKMCPPHTLHFVHTEV